MTVKGDEWRCMYLTGKQVPGSGTAALVGDESISARGEWDIINLRRTGGVLMLQRRRGGMQSRTGFTQSDPSNETSPEQVLAHHVSLTEMAALTLLGVNSPRLSSHASRSHLCLMRRLALSSQRNSLRE